MPTIIKQLRFTLIIFLLGTTIGILGILLTSILFEIQHLAFGYSIDHIHTNESYLQAVKAASPQRKVTALFICGLIAGIGWYLLYRYGKKLVSVDSAIKNDVETDKLTMPVRETIINSLLQIATIGLGSPLGKEGAPRELGALTASIFGKYFSLNQQDMRLLIAAGAGAGFAAVYNIPIGGALFTLEVLLKSAKLKWIIVTFTISIIASLIARLGLGNVHQYIIPPQIMFSWELLIFALLTGPLFAIAAHMFIIITRQARSRSPKKYQIIVYSVANFTLLGALLIILPELAGNGKSAAEVSFTGQITLQYAVLLLVAKVFVEWGSLRAGAQGGLLTPSFANGALMAIILGVIWCHFFSDIALGAFAIIGAATFLSVTNKMPITAVVITLEMTQAGLLFTLPIVVCVAIAWLTKRYLIPRIIPGEHNKLGVI